MGRSDKKAKAPLRRAVSESAAPSRGQRKRALKKASLISKIGLTKRARDNPKVLLRRMDRYHCLALQYDARGLTPHWSQPIFFALALYSTLCEGRCSLVNIAAIRIEALDAPCLFPIVRCFGGSSLLCTA